MSRSQTMATSVLVLCFVLAASFTGVLSADPGEGGFCVTLTLPDIDGLGACLGDTLETCQTSQTPIEILAPLLKCTLQALSKAGSPAQAVKALGDVIYLLLSAVDKDLASGFQTVIKLIPGSLTISGCDGTIDVSLPNTLVGQCNTDFGNLCSATQENLVPGLVDALVCLLKNALNNSPSTTVSQVLCDLFNVGDVAVGISGTVLDRIVDKIKDLLGC